MKEIGIDDKGRKMVVTDEGELKLVLPTGQSATFSRKSLARIVAEHQAEVAKWQKYLDALDGAREGELK
jgi:hypothetical protein